MYIPLRIEENLQPSTLLCTLCCVPLVNLEILITHFMLFKVAWCCLGVIVRNRTAPKETPLRKSCTLPAALNYNATNIIHAAVYPQHQVSQPKDSSIRLIHTTAFYQQSDSPRKSMFCTSLRKRPEWATVPNTLLSSQNPKWKGNSQPALHISNVSNTQQSKHSRRMTLPSHYHNSTTKMSSTCSACSCSPPLISRI